MTAVLPVTAIAETAYMLARLRAVESERGDSVLDDPFARRLSGQRGEELVERLPGGVAGAAGCIVRTCLIDRLLMQRLHTAGCDVVLNLGAGLDARPYRLPLPATLHWIEVDTADVLEYKSTVLEDVDAACRVESIALDVTDRVARLDLLNRVAQAGQNVLVISEGLLIYLPDAEVRSLAGDLSRAGNMRWWIADLASPEALAMFRRMLPSGTNLEGVSLRFAPQQGCNYFAEFGWRFLQSHSCVEEGRRLRRWLVPETVLRDLSEPARDVVSGLSRVVLLERADGGRPFAQTVFAEPHPLPHLPSPS